MVMTLDRFVHYKIGNERIDQEHWALFLMMDDVILDLQHKRCTDALIKIPTMLQALLSHFITETMIMNENEYPYRIAHFDDHNKMQRVITDLEKSLPALTNALQWQVTVYPVSNLEEMFIDHVDHFDRQLIEYLNKNG